MYVSMSNHSLVGSSGYQTGPITDIEGVKGKGDVVPNDPKDIPDYVFTNSFAYETKGALSCRG
ncbi:hypothetical protein VCR12J2_640423 [Vibrio coralliirubri]|nr:hypothetical protein VCR12J2_640423 [Vibrio coralliirubri]